MEKNGYKVINHSENRNKMNGDETPIILDGKATEKVPSEPSVIERTKEVLENIGTTINGL
ncbi:hypothetical protein FE783_36460 [Paenibacillus mesophilus]|uniref:hypothetical protein n=1 Tax=Paenibacillus mesophilus TaxID=2582849 RepID=UPI00110E73CA|nr:hypothetical protein [Paenibacillus mesophilus]TMV43049.1 hypothetical protein FE783_36460 [Paenibacillus mesophilus]